MSLTKGVFTLPNMPSYASLFCGTVLVFTLPGVNCLLELAPQFTLPDPTHMAVYWVSFFCKCDGSVVPGGITMSSFKREKGREREIRKLLII